MCEKPEGMLFQDWAAHRSKVLVEYKRQIKGDAEAARKRYRMDMLERRLKRQPAPVPFVRVQNGTLEYEAAIDVAIQRRVTPTVLFTPTPRSWMTVTFKRAWGWYQYHQALALRYKCWKLQSGIIRNDQIARMKMGVSL